MGRRARRPLRGRARSPRMLSEASAPTSSKADARANVAAQRGGLRGGAPDVRLARADEKTVCCTRRLLNVLQWAHLTPSSLSPALFCWCVDLDNAAGARLGKFTRVRSCRGRTTQREITLVADATPTARQPLATRAIRFNSRRARMLTSWVHARAAEGAACMHCPCHPLIKRHAQLRLRVAIVVIFVCVRVHSRVVVPVP
jgi:hypothetical protein